MSQISDRGGGGQAYLGHCPKFSCFLIMTPPLSPVLAVAWDVIGITVKHRIGFASKSIIGGQYLLEGNKGQESDQICLLFV